MGSLKAYGEDVNSIFELIGDKENDITKSIAWAMSRCPIFLVNIIKGLFGIIIDPDETDIFYQKYSYETGITDIEITDSRSFYIIIEAKRGLELPGIEQLTKYSLREDFIKSPAECKAIVSMSECSEEYAYNNLPFNEVNGIPVKHLSWKSIYDFADLSANGSSNEQKHLLRELKTYLGRIMTMQNKASNWVYVVVLSQEKPEGWTLSWIDIVQKKNRYFHPAGGNGWPKEPPNYIAFRYGGRLRSIHHIDSYKVTRNMHEEIPELPNEEWDKNYFVYRLGPAIIPAKEVKNGKIYPNGRKWAMLDTLLTSDTIYEACEISRKR